MPAGSIVHNGPDQRLATTTDCNHKFLTESLQPITKQRSRKPCVVLCNALVLRIRVMSRVVAPAAPRGKAVQAQMPPPPNTKATGDQPSE